ncbi:DHA2 family efflux MFS transporter permease subunit [Hydrogenophaga sp.]|uniref:DHA2 family efflux MFS transporter permease subunit n=1 Tax=Hydrogenophaga sp. TaxID=1904254 RepID=UPI00261C855F|nr:DHA2 family efflux MFS transporter permease subunit [Hydrogenophaga sp.]
MTEPASERVRRLLPWLVAVAFFMESLDTTILNTAVPAIAAALQVQPLSMKAVLSSYTLSVAVFVPVSGWLADRFGTRRVFATAIALFTLGSFLCGIATDIHTLVACRILQGMGGAMMVPVGRLTMVRTFPKGELVRAMSFVAIPSLIGPMLGPVAGGFIVHYLHWRAIFFVNIPIGLVGLYMVWRHLPDYRTERSDPLDWIGLVQFSSGIALLSYVLEVFGEHTLSGREMLALLGLSMALLAAYGRHAVSTPRPLLRLVLLRIRTFRVAVGGSFITRLGAGGMPFLLPLLYQVGMGYTPVQAALLIVAQPIAAISLKVFVPHILARLGYRRVLLWNTVLMGGLIMLFATIGPGTPVWQILLQGFLFGFCSSLQYSSMNTLVYADVSGSDTSMASTISSTLQQMSMSFGVATASLVAALFIPDRFHSNPAELIHGIHQAFLALGALTVLSALVFRELRADDGLAVSRGQDGASEASFGK